MVFYVFSNDKKKFVEWTAKDFSTDEPIKRTFKVQFSSKNAVAEFKAIFAEVNSVTTALYDIVQCCCNKHPAFQINCDIYVVGVRVSQGVGHSRSNRLRSYPNLQ